MRDRHSLLRAVGGALLGALPLLYTMEMWDLGRVFTAGRLLLLLAISIAVVWTCVLYSGFREESAAVLRYDVPIVFGTGLAVAAATLLVTGRIDPRAMPFDAALRLVALETVPCAIGAALAVTQLRPRKRADRTDHRIHRLPQDLQKTLAAIVGGVFFAFNIAPTEEVRTMAIGIPPGLLPAVVLASLGASYLIVFLADFADRPPHYREGALADPWVETLASYAIALAISYGFLWAFGHVGAGAPVDLQVAATVVLGYVTTIGAAAGRVLVAEA